MIRKVKHLFFLVAALLCSTSLLAYDFEADGIYYNITSSTDLTVSVTGGNKAYVTIPASVTYNGNTFCVTSIGDDAFYRCTGLTSITIPNSVTSIGEQAFYSCTGLTSITIPESVTSIGYLAFRDTPWFNNQSDGLIYIGKVCYVYKGEMQKNTTIIINEGTTSIGEGAFQNCTGLTSITIPGGVRSIGGFAFGNCTGLTSITIPESVTSIGEQAFYGCTGLTSITIPESVTSIGGSAFYGCTGLTSITIPESVTSIGNYAFYGCTGLTSINIPKSVTSIGVQAFYGCRGLTSITIPNRVTSIRDYAFSDCTGLTSITIPESVRRIRGGTFENCTGLTSITIPFGVKNIESRAFSGCTGLKTVINFSNLNIRIGSSSNGYVAYYADRVINAPNQIGDFLFKDSSEGNALVAYIGNETDITLPKDYYGENYCIGDYAFADCTGLTSITIPNSVTSIGNDAFRGCEGLANIIWDAGNYPDLSSAEDSPFINCNITSITFGENVTSIPKFLCSGMTTLEDVQLPLSLTSILHNAFEGCTGLTEITIPENVDRICPNAFLGCTNIKTIYCRTQEPPVCGSLALNGIDTCDCTLYVPEGKEALYKVADQWKEFFFIEEITGINAPKVEKSENNTFDIYDMSGRMVRKGTTTTDGLKSGLYIINEQKVLVE